MKISNFRKYAGPVITRGGRHTSRKDVSILPRGMRHLYLDGQTPVPKCQEMGDAYQRGEHKYII